jgi:hypothetical protein
MLHRQGVSGCTHILYIARYPPSLDSIKSAHNSAPPLHLRSPRNIIWVYFPPVMRHIFGRIGRIRISVQRPFWKLYLMSIPFKIITIVMGIGWMGGLTVLEVELMEAMCQTTWSLSVRIWILVGSMAYLGVVLLYLAGGSIILIFGNT